MTTLSLNTSLLGQLYIPFQPPDRNWAWSYDNTAYFVSQGSEYQLFQPTTKASTTTLNQTELDNITDAVDTLVETLGAIPNPSPEIQTWIADLTKWSNGLSLNDQVDTLAVTANLTHIVNNQGDDKAVLDLVYAWIPPLNAPILVSFNLSVDWAGTLSGIDTGIKTLGAALKTFKLLEEGIEDILIGLDIALSSTLVTFFSVAIIGLTIAAATAKFLINLGDDGGRANFIAVIIHAVNRITASLQPAPVLSGQVQVPTLDLDGLKYTWIRGAKDSTIISGDSVPVNTALIAGTYPLDCVPGNVEETCGEVLVSDFDTSAVYDIFAPELSWSLAGAGMILSSKISIDKNGEEIFGIALMVFSRQGKLLQVTTFFQSGDSGDSVLAPDPIAYPPSTLVPQSGCCGAYPLGSVIAEVIFVNGPFYQPSTLQLEWVIPEFMINCQNNIKLANLPSNNLANMPQPDSGYSISWLLGSPSYDTGQHATIAINSSNTVMQFHEGGTSNIYWDVGQLSGNTITWNSTGNKLAGGDWPSVSLRNNGTFLEIHSGGTINLYWDSGTATSSDASFDHKNGTQISDGNHPTMATNSSNLVVTLFTQGNSDLQYNIGQFSGSGSSTSISWKKTLVDYADGDHATIALTDSGYIVEVHSSGNKLYYNVGTASTSGITWKNASPLPLYVKANTTGLALRSDGLLCVVYEYDDVLYYGMGVLDTASQSIWWTSLENVIVGGSFAAVAFAPDGRVIETHQSDDDAMWWDIGTVTTP